MDETDVMRIFERSGAIVSGHFALSGGEHTDRYVNKNAVFNHYVRTQALCLALAERFQVDGTTEVSIVVGPASAGIVLAFGVSGALYSLTHKEVLNMYADPLGDSYEFRRGNVELLQGQNALVVDDISTTGGTAQKMIRITQAAGAKVVGFGALCNRGRVSAEALGVDRVEYLLNLETNLWQPKDCPQCDQGVEIDTKLGKGGAAIWSQAKR